ncbi:MAG: SemiSWEET transporter [Actinomycetota bacterium]|nr:SemiSWEET transporter [Actinomycetota bacterium]
MTLIGLLAGLLTTGCWLPQVIHTWTHGRSDQISALYLVCFAGGVMCWLAYGLSMGDVPLVLANAVSLVLVLSLAALKVRQGLAGGLEPGHGVVEKP